MRQMRMFAQKRALARRDDPETSHEAASSVANLTRKQQRVKRVLEEYGPMTDREIFLALLSKRYIMSTSGARTRRRELCDLGSVDWTGMTKRGKSGRRSRIWYAVDASMEVNQMPRDGKADQLMVECPGCGHVFQDEYSKFDIDQTGESAKVYWVRPLVFVGIAFLIIVVCVILGAVI